MSSSGVLPDDDCISEFETLKLRKTASYIIFQIVEEEIKGGKKHTIKIHSKGPKEATHEDFRTAISEMEKPCYAVIDYQGILCFIHWCPDGCAVRDKMILASSKDAFKKKLQGLKKEIQATEMSDLTEEEFSKITGQVKK